MGQFNRLTVCGESESGVYLDAGDHPPILLPNRYVPMSTKTGDELSVFVYLDSDDRPIATTEIPTAQVGEVKSLKCIAVNKIGAFLDWGLPKDLLVPFAEQHINMQEGRTYLVYVYIDKASHRIVASSKLDRHLDKKPVKYQKGQEVVLTVRRKTDLGYNLVVNNDHNGLLFDSEVTTPLKNGTQLTGYIKNVRDDGKIDLTLQKPITIAKNEVASAILKQLKDNDGFLALNDKSKPELIYKLFKVSKATFKKTLGKLYKERKIRIETNGIYLNKK